MPVNSLSVSLLHYIKDADPELLSLGLSSGTKAFEQKLEHVCIELFGTIKPEEIYAKLNGNPDLQTVFKTRLGVEADRLRNNADPQAGPSQWERFFPLFMPAVISMMILFMVMAVMLLALTGKIVDSPITQIVLAMVLNGFAAVIGFWLGSSSGSTLKLAPPAPRGPSNS